jgi:hypothetical protein
MYYPYTEIIDKLAIVFNDLEHLDETENANKIKEIIKDLEFTNSNLCNCGRTVHPDYENYCSECG